MDITRADLAKNKADSIREKKDKEIIDLLAVSPGHSWEIAAQAEMMLRLKGSIEKLDKNTQKYSSILIGLTVVLGILAVIQIYLLIK